MIALPAVLALASFARADVVPVPRGIHAGRGPALSLGATYRIEDRGVPDSRARRYLVEHLAALGAHPGAGGPSIVLAVRGEAVSPTRYGEPRQGYRLTVNQQEVTILGQTAAGLFQGVVSFLQWIGNRPASIGPVSMIDAPDLPLRGITIDFRYASMTRDQIRHAIDRVAALKGNLMVWWLQDRFAWTSHPELAGPGALSATEWGELVAYANDRFIEMVPYVDAYGHGERYLDHPAWVALSRSEHGYWGEDDVQYCASHPDSWRLFDDLSREAAAVFTNTRFFHIGMDEVGGQDDHLCPACRAAVRALAATTGEAVPYPRARNAFIAGRLNEAVARLAKLGRTAMLWDDSAVWIETLALGPGGIETVKDTNAVPFVWHYDADPARLKTALGRQGAARFRTVVATSSNDADNIERDITATAAFPHVIGAVATIWEGDVRSFDRRWPGFTQALALGWNRKAAVEARAAADALIPTGWGPLADPEAWSAGNEESPPPAHTPDAPRAVRFSCPFPGLKDWRVVWDASSRLNLAGRTTIAVRIRAADPTALQAAVVYLHAGGGWYKLPDFHPGSDWTTTELAPAHAVVEGIPAGWDAIDGVRVSLLPAGIPRRATMFDLALPDR